jgi:hypothetical protein
MIVILLFAKIRKISESANFWQEKRKFLESQQIGTGTMGQFAESKYTSH